MALSLGQFINVGGMVKDLKSFNFSVYGRWFGYINIILCIALGIANLFHVSGVIAFGIISIIQGLVILFIEIPFFVEKSVPLAIISLNSSRDLKQMDGDVFSI
ncbi:Tvp18p [Saccharomyces cerevisiae FostersO]|nr:Tvp18p [Saccharomyces cerevisiae FostersO]